MKNVLYFLIFIFSFYSFAQCTYDESCTISPAFPNICPMQLPNATVGESYDTDLTFWMPVDFEAEGFAVTLTELAVSQITGLPIGLSIELSNESMVFYPSESEFGCANVNGVPFAAGDYVITVYVVANVTVASVGFEIAYPTQFDLYLTVNPGSGGNNSFIYSPNNGCEDLDVNFEALITSEEYDVEYIWDFGNGITSNEQYPNVQVYDEPGDYEVSLVTNLTANTIELDSFTIDWVSSDCYGGDFEEYCWDLWLIGSGCWSDPDLLLKIYDANTNLIYQTGGIGSGEYITGTSASWSNIGLVLNNPPYTVEIWDTEAWDILDGLEDLVGIPLDVQVSDDDLLGSYVLNLEDGQTAFNSSCSYGKYVIVSNETPLNSITDSEIISVFEQPNLETFFDNDLDLVYVDYESALNYQWIFNGEPLDNTNTESYTALESGEYYVEITTENGCYSISEPIDVLICDDNITPSISASGSMLFTADTENNVDWYFNDELYDSGLSITPSSDGYYYVVLTDESGCSWTSETIFYQSIDDNDLDNDGINDDIDDDVDGDGVVNSEDDDVDGDGIPDEIDNDVDGDGIDNDIDDTISGYLFSTELSPSSISLFPNPSNGFFSIKILDSSLLNEPIRVLLTDLNGRVVIEDYIISNNKLFDASFLTSSTYIINMYLEGRRVYSRSIIIK